MVGSLNTIFRSSSKIFSAVDLPTFLLRRASFGLSIDVDLSRGLRLPLVATFLHEDLLFVFLPPVLQMLKIALRGRRFSL